jgi:hypothetical protein
MMLVVFSGTFTKFQKAFICLPVSPHETTASTGHILRNLIFEVFLKIHKENSTFIKIWQE